MPADSDATDSSAFPSLQLDQVAQLPFAWRRQVQTITSLGSNLAILTVLGKLIQAVWDKLQKPETRSTVLVGALFLLLTSLLAIIKKLIQRFFSSSQSAGALRLALDKICLAGREIEIETVMRGIHNAPLVFLVGDAGSGKTAILAQGLIKRLSGEGPFLPLYVDSWGSDWVEGPRQSLAYALFRTLGSAECSSLALRAPIPPADALGILTRIHDELQKTPVLLFDQFDAYLATHHGRFVAKGGHQASRPVEVAQNNSFWAELAQMLAGQKVRCLIAVREQVPLAFLATCLPGIAMESSTLDWLDSTTAGTLLDRVLVRAVASQPQKGSAAIRNRLLTDLSGTRGMVLPAQMRLALQGLALLGSPTIRAYVGFGGLHGVEALALENEIAKAAWFADCTPDQLYPLLSTLTDTTTLPRRICAESDLLKLLPPGKQSADKLKLVLDHLRRAGILECVAHGAPAEAAWRLNHIYLCRGLAFIGRRGHYWQALLDSAAEAYRGASTPVRRWFALLRPMSQMRVAYERLRHRVRYGSARHFALLSTLRLLVNPLMVALAIALLSYRWTIHRPVLSPSNPDLAKIPFGPVICWNNASQQRVPAPQGKGFFQVTVGDSQACARAADNSVDCWDGKSYRLQSHPGPYLQVNAGGDHACALRVDSTVDCWNARGERRSTPVEGEIFDQISAGTTHDCGIKPDGSIDCWEGDRITHAPLGQYKQVSAAIDEGRPRACGVRRDRRAVCWDVRQSTELPALRGDLFGVSAAAHKTCGLKTDYRAVCRNSAGQEIDIGEVQLDHISAGGAQICGLTQNQQILCWNDRGKPQDLPTFQHYGYFHVAVGPTFTCALALIHHEGRAERAPSRP